MLWVCNVLCMMGFVFNSRFCADQRNLPSNNVLGYPFTRDWSPKFETGLNIIIDIVQKLQEWPCSLFFCQNDVLIGGSFWQKHRLVTLILFEQYLLWYLAQSQVLVISLYMCIVWNFAQFNNSQSCQNLFLLSMTSSLELTDSMTRRLLLLSLWMPQ